MGRDHEERENECVGDKGCLSEWNPPLDKLLRRTPSRSGWPSFFLQVFFFSLSILWVPKVSRNTRKPLNSFNWTVNPSIEFTIFSDGHFPTKDILEEMVNSGVMGSWLMKWQFQGEIESSLPESFFVPSLDAPKHLISLSVYLPKASFNVSNGTTRTQRY